MSIEPQRVATLGAGGSPFLPAQLALLGLLALDDAAPQVCLTAALLDQHALTGVLVADIIVCGGATLLPDQTSMVSDTLADVVALSAALLDDAETTTATVFDDAHSFATVIPEDC